MNRMKKLTSPLIFLLVLVLLPACETGFEDLNTSRTAATDIAPDYLISLTELAMDGIEFEHWRTNMIYTSSMMQHVWNSYYSGRNYALAGNENWYTALWLMAYRGDGDVANSYIPALQNIVAKTSDDPAEVNKLSVARILRAFAFHRVTDLYGDIPYFEAGKGILENNVTPKYDPQSEIYADMLKELEEAINAFDPSLPTYGTADFLYDGDITKWKKFGYSLMLRLAERLVKVDPGMAQQWATKAINGGVMTDATDSAIIPHTAGPSTGPNGVNSNGVGDLLFDTDNPRLAGTFVDWMKEHGDPRLPLLAGQYSGNANTTTATLISTDPDDLIGWPLSYDTQTIQTHPTWVPCEPTTAPPVPCGVQVYAQPNRFVRNWEDPSFWLSYAETEFRLADAALRWGIGGDAATHYNNGVRAAMKQLVLFDPAAEISDEAIDAYLAANPFDPARGLEMVHTQLWASLFLNGYEAFANWRATGYPVLTEVNLPGSATGGKIPRRLLYPSDEELLNAENFQEAIARQGPDDFMTRVWWDQ